MQTCMTSDDPSYAVFERIIAQRVADAPAQLFTTDFKTPLFPNFIAGLPISLRKHYTCRCCEHFITTYGGLVTTDKKSILWGLAGIPELFESSCVMMLTRIARSKINGVFLTDAADWGWSTKKTQWTHLHGTYRYPVENPSVKMASLREEYGMLQRALHEIPKEAVIQALRVINTDLLYRDEKVRDLAEWFRDLDPKNLWVAVANAPKGWCHIKTNVLNTLFDDIIAELPFNEIKHRWDLKMHPLAYRRGSAPVKAGAIEAANKELEKLGGDFNRRWANLEDVVALWKPSLAESREGGYFDSLKTPKIKPVLLPGQTVSWQDLDLIHARKIELFTPSSGDFVGLVIGDGPSILKWDNNVSRYLYHGGSPATNWGIYGCTWVTVTAICYKPCEWTYPFGHQDVIFLLEGCQDQNKECHGSLFKEILHSKYHAIENVIEAYAKSHPLTGTGTAQGYLLQQNQQVTLRIDGTTYAVRL